MKKLLNITLLLLIFTGFALNAAGCVEEEEEEEFDQAALVAVDSYIFDMTAALSDSTLRADLQGWTREYYEPDEPPFHYDEERRQWLSEHKEELEGVRQKHLQGSDFPAEEEIVQWQVIIGRSGRERLLEGEELVEGLNKLEALYIEMTAVLEMIATSDGELNMEQSERILELLEDIDPVVREVRSVLAP